MNRWSQPGGFPRIVRGQLDISGNLMSVKHIYSGSEALSHWGYGTYVYFLDMSRPIVVTREEVLEHFYSNDPRNPLPLGRNDKCYQRSPGENITASSDSLPFVEALKSGEVPSRPRTTDCY